MCIIDAHFRPQIKHLINVLMQGTDNPYWKLYLFYWHMRTQEEVCLTAHTCYPVHRMHYYWSQSSQWMSRKHCSNAVLIIKCQFRPSSHSMLSFPAVQLILALTERQSVTTVCNPSESSSHYQVSTLNMTHVTHQPHEVDHRTLISCR